MEFEGGSKEMKHIAESVSPAAAPEASASEISSFPFRFDSEEAPEILVTDINLLQSLLRERTTDPHQDRDEGELY